MARFRMQFGTGESLQCLTGIKRFNIKTTEGEKDVCYAAKVTTEAAVLPYRSYVDGYILASDSDSYYELTPENTQYHQTIGNLPEQLPKYDLSPIELGYGHSLWIAIAAIAGSAIIKAIKKEHRAADSHETEEAVSTYN